jgi:hypothetical protein
VDLSGLEDYYGTLFTLLGREVIWYEKVGVGMKGMKHRGLSGIGVSHSHNDLHENGGFSV